MGKRRSLDSLNSGPREKKPDPERAEYVRQMWLKDLHKIIGGWTVGSESTKRSHPDFQRDPSESVRPKRPHRSCREQSPTLIDLTIPTIVSDVMFRPVARKPYSESVPEAHPMVDVPLHESEEAPPNPVGDPTSRPKSPFVSVDISSAPEPEPMNCENVRPRRRPVRVSGKQLTTLACYFGVCLIILLIIRLISGEFVV